MENINDAEILIYKITAEENGPVFFRFLPATVKYDYSLHYRIGEDRFWITFKINNRIVNSNHTKNGMMNSLKIIENIKRRLSSYKEYKFKDIKCYELRKENYELFMKILNETKEKEEREQEKRNEKFESKEVKFESKESTKPPLRGIFLS